MNEPWDQPTLRDSRGGGASQGGKKSQLAGEGYL